ncbi:LptF/LptG family permease [Waterburya agarophytonicola K14]|uniref:LptF/LptG family permease n=1 Tax=Waterburya agarophytonicola KI4 TaxID=2874699 RepID=A0A964FJ05_9CYAN|nr:LptF/LptG family permease [Waterburya agarophytonicola]MCC0178408.1 LptF/LptG family permease [Waterburya agarophytonicola KI4]
MKIGKFQLFDPSSMGLSVMNLYIIKELTLPFLFGMGIFTSLGLSIGAVFELIRKVTDSGLYWGVAFKVLLLRMPEFIVFAFPMSILLATLMAYSRLSSDSELVALRSIGVNVYRLIMPAIAFSLCIVTITFFFNNFVAPAANYQAEVTLKQALGKTRPDFETENILFDEYQNIETEDGKTKEVLTRLFYAEEFDGEQMRNLTVLDRSRRSVSQIVVARSAKWNVLENIWDFYDGTIYLVGVDGAYNNVVRFQHQQLALPQTALDITKKGKDTNQMNIFEAREYLEIVKHSADEQRIRKWQVRIQEKMAIPFACLVFALIGMALGIKPQNSGKATSFGICIGLIFGYYLLSFISQSLGISGVLPPWVAAWLPNFLGLGAASGLLAQSVD